MVKKIYVSLLCIILLLGCFSAIAFADDSTDMGSDENNGIASENVEISSLRISANQTSGLHSVMLSLIGDYNPIVKDYTYTSSNGYTSHSIDIQPDWSWIATCALFIVVIYCVFRLFGLALGGIR